MALIIDPSTPVTLAQAVGNVLSSLVEAQAQAARTTVDFIESVGFESATTGAPALRQVRFSYRKLDENQQEAAYEVDIPLLGMVDIPLIAIRKATIQMEYEVSSVQEPAKTSGSDRFTKGVQIKGRVLSGRSGSERGSIKVSVDVEKAELPPGLARALDILELAASEKPQPAPG